MFTTPIQHRPLRNLDEVLKFSYPTDFFATPLTKWQNNGHIAFADQNGNVHVTPYRVETHPILEEAGYIEKSLSVPFSNSENRPDFYKWLVKIAEEENWAYTHEKAYEIALSKCIQPVRVKEKYQVKEITFYDDTKSHIIYKALTLQFLHNNSAENIGTYIVVDDKTVVVCDEYGRTFLVKVKTVINDFVNALIDARYTRTQHPEWYIQEYSPEA